jgi:hypothetical protein
MQLYTCEGWYSVIGFFFFFHSAASEENGVETADVAF